MLHDDKYICSMFPVINTLLDDESERITSIVMIRGSRCRLLERGICLRIQTYILETPIPFLLVFVHCNTYTVTIFTTLQSLRLRLHRIDAASNCCYGFWCRTTASPYYDAWSGLLWKPLLDAANCGHYPLCKVAGCRSASALQPRLVVSIPFFS